MKSIYSLVYIFLDLPLCFPSVSQKIQLQRPKNSPILPLARDTEFGNGRLLRVMKLHGIKLFRKESQEFSVFFF